MSSTPRMVYVCPECSVAIPLDHLHRIEAASTHAQVSLTFFCPCRDEVLTQRYAMNRSVLERLVGGSIASLPWVNPIQHTLDVDEKVMAEWRWELEQLKLEGWDGLLWWLEVKNKEPFRPHRVSEDEWEPPVRTTS